MGDFPGPPPVDPTESGREWSMTGALLEMFMLSPVTAGPKRTTLECVSETADLFFSPHTLWSL